MIHPISTANSTKATNPPKSGQYMAVNIYERGGRSASYVERDLLVG